MVTRQPDPVLQGDKTSAAAKPCVSIRGRFTLPEAFAALHRGREVALGHIRPNLMMRPGSGAIVRRFREVGRSWLDLVNGLLPSPLMQTFSDMSSSRHP